VGGAIPDFVCVASEAPLDCSRLAHGIMSEQRRRNERKSHQWNVHGVLEASLWYLSEQRRNCGQVVVRQTGTGCGVVWQSRHEVIDYAWEDMGSEIDYLLMGYLERCFALRRG
jgi:hypothetical protein